MNTVMALILCLLSVTATAQVSHVTIAGHAFRAYEVENNKETLYGIAQKLGVSQEEILRSGFDTYFVDRTAGVYPTAASGFPWSAASMAVKGDVIADLNEDLAAEQKARVTYDNILRLSDDPDVNNVIRYLREREVVHYQRFGEALRKAMEKMDQKNIYAVNPSFDMKP